jgi:hypothetical protein
MPRVYLLNFAQAFNLANMSNLTLNSSLIFVLAELLIMQAVIVKLFFLSSNSSRQAVRFAKKLVLPTKLFILPNCYF